MLDVVAADQHQPPPAVQVQHLDHVEPPAATDGYRGPGHQTEAPGAIGEKTDQQVVLNVFKEGKSETVRFRADDVDDLVLQKKSLMPDRLLRDLTAQQAADLVEFLASLKQ